MNLFIFIMMIFAAFPATIRALTAKITVDDYQWYENNGNPVDLELRFPDAQLTRHYAPLPVFFQGWESTPRNTIVDYKWDFGDESPAKRGFNAAYVYETPGIYTVTLTVIDTLGQTDTDEITIEVLERDGTTYYVDSQNGSDNFDGLSPLSSDANKGPWKTADKAFTEMATDLYKPGDQILFNRGQSFELTASEIIPGAWPSWGYMFGAYGKGSKPVIQYRGENNAIVIHQYSIGLAHVCFVDLDLRLDDYDGHKAGTFFFAQGGGTRNILFLRVDALDGYADLFTIGRYLEREISTGTFIINCSITNTSIHPLDNSTLFAVWGSRVALLNNYFDLSGNHIGYTAIDKGVITGNTFSRPAFGRTALRICGFQEEDEDWNENLTSNNVQISNNKFHGWIDPETEGRAHNGGGNRYNYLLVQLSPNGPWNQIIRDITFERNIITNGEGMLSIGACENIIVRNNIFMTNNNDKPSYLVKITDANKPSKNIDLSGNTFVARNAQYSGNIYQMSAAVYIENNITQTVHPFDYKNHQQINIANNIFYSYGDNNFTRFLLIEDIDEVLLQVKSDGNLFFASEGTKDGKFFQIGIAPDETSQYFTLKEWQKSQSQDLSSLYGDPLFFDILGKDELFSDYGFDADLRIGEKSAARNIGKLEKSNSYFDISESCRYNEDQKVDAGAFEFGSKSIVSIKQSITNKKRFGQVKCFPNPFKTIATIQYTIPDNNPAQNNLTLSIYNSQGRKIAVLVQKRQRAGTYKFKFNGNRYTPGIYYYILGIGSENYEKGKIILLK